VKDDFLAEKKLGFWAIAAILLAVLEHLYFEEAANLPF
jgi:hypothetical protein